MKIAFFGVEASEEGLIQRSFPNDDIFFSEKKMTKGSLAKMKNVEVLVVFVDSPVSSDVIRALPKLRGIATMSTGFDHIDIEECKKKGIVVCNVPCYGENTVAEHTFALLLAMSRKLLPSIEQEKRGSLHPRALRGFDLQRKTLGIIGCGNIGQHVARIAQGFQMKVVVFDLYPNRKLAAKLGFQYVSLPKLLGSSDIVTIHVPYNKHTHHLLGKKEFLLMKKGAYLINTARGGIVDTDALVQALKNHHLAGAALDVLEEEDHMCEEVKLLTEAGQKECNLSTLLENHILLQMPHVLVTPHNAFNTKEALQRILDITLENIKSIKRGKPRNRVGRG
ncbi:MAG TPA: NAD(P)-dependent oxidoreductase [Candidatus Nanoarchaeia archaeon]|nr:NAD(P)-dependent oxidoreductase [Candidatus Nanoarchaeia archaeon]